MAIKTHTKNDGSQGKCTAKPGNCPKNQSDEEHVVFETQKEMREYNEKILERKQGGLINGASVTKNPKLGAEKTKEDYKNMSWDELTENRAEYKKKFNQVSHELYEANMYINNAIEARDAVEEEDLDYAATVMNKHNPEVLYGVDTENYDEMESAINDELEESRNQTNKVKEKLDNVEKIWNRIDQSIAEKRFDPNHPNAEYIREVKNQVYHPVERIIQI